MTKILSVAIVVIFLIASPVRLLASSAYAAAEDESKDAPFYLRSSIDFNRDNDEADNTYNNNNNVVDVVTKPSNDLEQQEQQQDERELLFWNRCANGRRTPYCVCREDELRAEIGNASTDRDDPTRIRICLGQDITLRSPIDITGKSFSIGCGPFRIPGQCGVSGVFKQSSGPAFIGEPVYGEFYGIYMESFNNTVLQGLNGTGYANGGLGGVMYITGGYVKCFECQFLYSYALRGGGIYATGPDTTIVLDTSLVSENVADYGGGVYATDNATFIMTTVGLNNNIALEAGGALHFDSYVNVTMEAAVFLNNTAEGTVSGYDMYIEKNVTYVNCTASGGFRNRDPEPNRFCDGSLDSILIPGVSDDTGLDVSTNCHRTVDLQEDAIFCNRFRRQPEY